MSCAATAAAQGSKSAPSPVIREQGRNFATQIGVTAAGFAHIGIALRRIAVQGFLEDFLNLLQAFHAVSYFPPAGARRFSSSKKLSRTVTLSMGARWCSAVPPASKTTATRLPSDARSYG